MNIQMIGIDHSLASVDVRALFSFTKAAGAVAMDQIAHMPGIQGCIILSTCNRMEMWIHADQGREIDLLQILCEIKNKNTEEYRKYFKARQGEDAVRHLFRMTSGLKSLILGEDQILTQVKTALENGRDAYSTDSVLETLFRMAITGAKKVKSGMQRSMTNVSAIEQAIHWMKEERGMDFAGRKCMVIGNGEMGKRAALAFMAEGADVTVTVRQYRSGVVDIPRGCARINYGDRLELLPSCELVVSATSSPNMTLVCEDVAPRMQGLKQIYIDLAVPRDIDPKIGELENAELFTIDDFAVTESEENQEILRHAEAILEEQILEFLNWYHGRDMIPRVHAIGKAAAEDTWWRMGKTVKKMKLDPEEAKVWQDAVQTASDKVVEKMLFTLGKKLGGKKLTQKVYGYGVFDHHEKLPVEIHQLICN